MNLSTRLARKQGILRLVSVSLMATVMFGCAKKEEKDTYSYLWDNKFSSCGLACHNSGASDGSQNGPDLSSKDKFYTNLVNRSISVNYSSWTGRTGNCNAVKFIKPSDANNSTLAGSLISSVSDVLKANNSGCDTAFSFHEANHVTIKDSELAQGLTDWINKGAQNN